MARGHGFNGAALSLCAARAQASSGAARAHFEGVGRGRTAACWPRVAAVRPLGCDLLVISTQCHISPPRLLRSGRDVASPNSSSTNKTQFSQLKKYKDLGPLSNGPFRRGGHVHTCQRAPRPDREPCVRQQHAAGRAAVQRRPAPLSSRWLGQTLRWHPQAHRLKTFF